MSLICQVVIGYFHAEKVCAQRTIDVIRPLEPGQVARLQAPCDGAFGIHLRLAEYLTPDGLLFIQDVRIRPDTHKAAAVAHGLFDMSAVDCAHGSVLYPPPDDPLPEPEALMEGFRWAGLDLNEREARQEADEIIEHLRQERDVQQRIQERVRQFARQCQCRRTLRPVRASGSLTNRARRLQPPLRAGAERAGGVASDESSGRLLNGTFP